MLSLVVFKTDTNEVKKKQNSVKKEKLDKNKKILKFAA